mgnify:CR=1 FL=1
MKNGRFSNAQIMAVLKQAQRDIASAQEKYARAGWPLPPGAMLNDMAMIRQDSRDKLAEQSVHCRIGSSEKARHPIRANHPVHSRIGSSEINRTL